jgi:glycosyltransferase involved in cell wall biosynthesis
MSKRIFVISDFKDESSKSINTQPRMFVKGLIRNGYDVQRFSYRNILTQFNPFSGKHFRRFMPKFVKRYTDKLLTEQLKAYSPDAVLVLSMKYLTPDTIRAIRAAVPNTVLVGRDEDGFPEKNQERLAIARLCDMVVNTSAGAFLETYKKAGVPRCAFLPNFCDPDIQHCYEVSESWRANIIFTGKVTHVRLGEKGDRYNLIKSLAVMPNCRVYGSLGTPRVFGLEYYYAICGAKIALSINVVNDITLYHSDRLINYLSCGAFVLARRVPQTERLFEDKKHLRYFDTEEEFFELADWYLKHDEERTKIAAAGMEYVHREYNCTRMARLAMDLIETGSCDAPWEVIL